MKNKNQKQTNEKPQKVLGVHTNSYGADEAVRLENREAGALGVE